MENLCVGFHFRECPADAKAFEQTVDVFVANCKCLLDESVALAANIHSTLQWVRLCAALGTALNDIIQEHARLPPVTDQAISLVDVDSCAASDSHQIASSSLSSHQVEDENPPKTFGQRASAVLPKLRVRLKTAKQRKPNSKALPPERRYIMRQFGQPPSRSCALSSDQRAKTKSNRGRPRLLIDPCPCPYCGVVFTFKRQFDLHVERHEREYEHATCAICTYRTKDKRDLRRHLKTVHPQPARATFVCAICSVSCSRSSALRKHMASHVAPDFRCPVCPYRTENPKLLRYHSRTHNERNVRCEAEGCGMLFKSQQAARVHAMRMHLRQSEPPTVCDLCGKEVFKYDLRDHLRTHARQERRALYCAICGQRAKNKGCLQMHISRDHIRTERLAQLTFTCKICNAKYQHSKPFRKHMAAHEVASNFACPFCDYQAKSKLLLKMHRRIHQPRVLPCPFEGCSLLFKTRHCVRVHYKGVHLQVRPKMCEVCGKRFRDSKTLAQHTLSHTGVRPYMCYVCGRTFSQFQNMRYHVVTIHKVEFDRSLNRRNAAYRVFDFPPEHPKPAQRSVAAPSSNAPSQCIQVKKRKSKNCEICARRCADLQDLREHMRSHEGEKAFMCYICGRTFTWFNNMKHHVITIHKAEFDPAVNRWNAAYKVYDFPASQQPQPAKRTSARVKAKSACKSANQEASTKSANQNSSLESDNQASSSSPEAANQASSSLRLDEADYLPSGELNSADVVASTSGTNRSAFSGGLTHQAAANSAAPFMSADQSIFGHVDYFDPLSMTHQPHSFAAEQWQLD